MRREFRRSHATDAMLAQFGQEGVIEDKILAGNEVRHALANLFQLLGGRHAGLILRALPLLLHELQAPHANHEELIEI